MRDPVTVEVLRGGAVESRHAIAVAVADAEGRLVLALGDVEQPVFPRSAVKVMQALPLIETGAADAYGFGPRELALSTASHNGEVFHVETAAAMLGRAGRGEADLECGPHWPNREEDHGLIHRGAGRPNRLHNNCSGKHAGFVCLACHTGLDPRGYIGAGHGVQRFIAEAIEDVTRSPLVAAPTGIDGCGIPTYAQPLAALAAGFARLGTGVGLAPARATAARRLLDAAIAHPEMIAGTDRFDTLFIPAIDRAAYVKVGAEGVYCATFPALGLGVALKCQDGTARAAEVAMATIAAHLLGRRDDPALARFMTPELSNWSGVPVGGLRPAEGFDAALAEGLPRVG